MSVPYVDIRKNKRKLEEEDVSQTKSSKEAEEYEIPSKISKTDDSSITSEISVCTTVDDKDTVKDTKEKSVDNTALVAEHYNCIKEVGFTQRNQSRIVYMRNFNNWIKSMLISEYLEKYKQDKNYGTSLKVLDMCCGKGGDLLKWKKANITHLICADIAEVAIDQCRTRYNEMVNRKPDGYGSIFSAEFIAADCTKVSLRKKYKDPSVQFDLVSCQFSFHYCFESLQQAECMIKNASECLKPGGYFIGTIPDAYDLVSRWHQAEDNKFGNDVYSVEFLCEDKTKPPLFGAKYNFDLEGVVNCPEFLVHLPTLQKLALKFGLELVTFERFGNYYERMKNEGKSLLGRMQALETYPPFHEVSLVGKPNEDYQHAAQYMQNTPGHRRIGTLSQAEWEVTSLYAVFAFKKMKPTWNSDGKMEYVKV